MKALVAAAKSGQFEHVLERALQDRDAARERAQAESELAARLPAESVTARWFASVTRMATVRPLIGC